MKHNSEPPPEFRLAAACCLWPPSPRRDQAIRAEACPAIDWPRFLRVVKRQRVAGLAQQGLAGAGVAMPPEIARELTRRAAVIADLGLKYAAESVRLQRLFDQAGIPVLFFKGASLAMLAYGSLAVKHGKDIDLLVSPDKAGAALALLEDAGYRLWKPAPRLTGTQLREVLRYGKEIELIHRDSNLQVELHWRLVVNSLLLKDVGLSTPRQEVALAPGQTIRTLGEEDLFAYLCVHGALHAWFRLKWLADFNALIAGRSDADITRLYRHAQAKGAGLCAGQALLLCGRILQTRLPPALASELEGDRRLEKLAAIAQTMMIGPDAGTEVYDRPFGTARTLFAQFRLGQGWRYRLAHARLSFVSIEDVFSYPLPEALRFLYPVMYFPLWLLRHFRSSRRASPPVPVRGA
jgi:hypothetical protein